MNPQHAGWNIQAAEVLKALDELIRTAPAEGRAGMVVALAAGLAQLGASMVVETEAARPKETAGADANLSVWETAARLGISTAYIYKHSRSLPFVVRIGRRMLCSARGVEQWNRRRMGLG